MDSVLSWAILTFAFFYGLVKFLKALFDAERKAAEERERYMLMERSWYDN